MKLLIWYSRSGGKVKNKYGVQENILQYGLKTGIEGLDFSIYLNSPRRPGETEVNFANFKKSQYSYQQSWFEDEAEMDSYLWFLLERELGKKVIKRIFGE